MSRFSIRLTMLSDWHIGSGAGRHGSIDKLLDRDGDGLPYTPASSLRGIWRDATERLALGLDDGVENGNWTGLVNLIFGSQPGLSKKGDKKTRPVGGCISFGDLKFPPVFRRKLAHSAALKNALTFVKPGVMIEKNSGRAKDDHLRFEEMGRTGAVFTVDGHIDLGKNLPEDLHAPAKALLVAAARLVERIGGKRRRGAGRCKLDVCLSELKLDKAIKILKETGNIELPGKGESSPTSVLDYCTSTHSSAWTEISFKAEIKSPVIIADQVMGNVVTCMDFIPGFYLLKVVADALLKAGLDPRPHIAAGNIQVLPLYPMLDGQRSQPVPLCWESKKSESDQDNLSVTNRLSENSDVDTAQMKPYRAGFIGQANDKTKTTWLPFLKKVLRTHNVVDDDEQRPNEKVGGVFTYEAIAAGQVFSGCVRLHNDAGIDVEKFAKILAGEITIGRARRIGYGRLALSNVKSTGVAQTSDNDSGLWVWLTSDLLLSGNGLGGATTISEIADELESALGQKGLFDRKQIRAEIRTRRIESWQASWGLPRPSLVALQAGSVIHLPFDQDNKPDVEKLSQLAQTGLGERRGEGFGQISLNDPVVSAELPQLKKAKNCDAIEADRGNEDIEPEISDFAKFIEKVSWQREIEQAAEMAAGDKQKREDILGWQGDKPNSSQLGVLRSLLGQIEDMSDVSSIQNWLEKITELGKADKWGGEDSIQKLRKLIKKDAIWQEIGCEKRDSLELFALRTFLLRAMHHHRRANEEDNREVEAV